MWEVSCVRPLRGGRACESGELRVLRRVDEEGVAVLGGKKGEGEKKKGESGYDAWALFLLLLCIGWEERRKRWCSSPYAAVFFDDRRKTWRSCLSGGSRRKGRRWVKYFFPFSSSTNQLHAVVRIGKGLFYTVCIAMAFFFFNLLCFTYISCFLFPYLRGLLSYNSVSISQISYSETNKQYDKIDNDQVQISPSFLLTVIIYSAQ